MCTGGSGRNQHIASNTTTFSMNAPRLLSGWFVKHMRWTPKRLEIWERRRRLGLRRYALRYGVLGWGAPMVVLMTLYQYWQEFGLAWDEFNSFFLIVIAINLAIYPTGGWFLGRYLWTTYEKSYRVHQESRPQPDLDTSSRCP